MYKCHDCGRQFVGGKRLDTQDIIKDYVEGKQTLAQLAEKYGVNKSTIWRRIGCMRRIRVISRYKDVVINMDTTYWGRGFGLMVIKDAFRNKILWYKFVRNETVAGYLEVSAGFGTTLHDPWHSLRRPWRAVFRFGKAPCADVPVPSGDDCAPLPYIKA